MIPADVRIFVCTQPQDMRRSFDALEQTARQAAGVETRNGALFVFLNKRCNRSIVGIANARTPPVGFRSNNLRRAGGLSTGT